MERQLVLFLFLVRGIGLGLVVFPGVLRFVGLFRLFHYFRAAFAFGRRRGGPGRRRRTGAFLRVVGHVPARAFELHGWSRDHLFDDAPAFGALSQLLVGELADLFEAVSALIAQVFVVGHVCGDFRGGDSSASILWRRRP